MIQLPNKRVVLFSGGPDSLAASMRLTKLKLEHTLLYFPNTSEATVSTRNGNMYETALNAVAGAIGKKVYIGPNHGLHVFENKKTFEVPGRNMFLALSAAVQGAEEIYFGIEKNSADYTDRSDVFLRNASETISNLFGKDILVTSNIFHLTKSEAIGNAILYSENFALASKAFNETVSCFNPADDKFHCGTCSACKARYVAFTLANNYLSGQRGAYANNYPLKLETAYFEPITLNSLADFLKSKKSGFTEKEISTFLDIESGKEKVVVSIPGIDSSKPTLKPLITKESFKEAVMRRGSLNYFGSSTKWTKIPNTILTPAEIHAEPLVISPDVTQHAKVEQFSAVKRNPGVFPMPWYVMSIIYSGNSEVFLKCLKSFDDLSDVEKNKILLVVCVNGKPTNYTDCFSILTTKTLSGKRALSSDLPVTLLLDCTVQSAEYSGHSLQSVRKAASQAIQKYLSTVAFGTQYPTKEPFVAFIDDDTISVNFFEAMEEARSLYNTLRYKYRTNTLPFIVGNEIAVFSKELAPTQKEEHLLYFGDMKVLKYDENTARDLFGIDFSIGCGAVLNAPKPLSNNLNHAQFSITGYFMAFPLSTFMGIRYNRIQKFWYEDTWITAQVAAKAKPKVPFVGILKQGLIEHVGHATQVSTNLYDAYQIAWERAVFLDCKTKLLEGKFNSDR